MRRPDPSVATRPPVRIVGDPLRVDGPFVFTCEHASNRLIGVEATPGDRALLDDHWGWDKGIAPVTEALARDLGCVAVLSDFSRLLVDPNRAINSPTLIVERCGDVPVSFNQGLAPAEIRHRIETLYAPYHGAVDRICRARLARGPAHLVSMHSYTADFLGQRRTMEVGVLFDAFESEARALGAALKAEGFVVALNEPYSGKAGAFTYSIMKHGLAHGVPFVELEVRNDLIETAAQQADVAARIGRALKVFAPG